MPTKWVPDVTQSLDFSATGKAPGDHSPNATDGLMRCISSYLPSLLALLAQHFVQEHCGVLGCH